MLGHVAERGEMPLNPLRGEDYELGGMTSGLGTNYGHDCRESPVCCRGIVISVASDHGKRAVKNQQISSPI